MKVLVVGGAGYIGSHTCVDLLNNRFEIVVVDNFSNSKPEEFNRLLNQTVQDADQEIKKLKQTLINF